nr:hypothetical protein CFP56_79411 [Quercus suber]
MKGRKEQEPRRDKKSETMVNSHGRRSPFSEPPGIPFNYCGLPHRHSRLPWVCRVSLLRLRWCDRPLKVADVGVRKRDWV